jgi:hypothetical protein
MNTSEIKKLVKHIDCMFAFIPSKRLGIYVPNPFDMQSTIVINYQQQFNEWEEKWELSGFENKFIIISETSNKIVIETTCKKYQEKKQEFLSTFKSF